jgi:pimeloyl-ACP methyl ester carboxylesterase
MDLRHTPRSSENTFMSTSQFLVNSCITASLLICTGTTAVGQAPPNPEIPGGVQLNNGLILYGLCDSASSINPVNSELPQNRALELRRINQQFRTYLVATRRSAAAEPDDLAVPKEDFRIIQKRESQRPLNYEVGRHDRSPFGPNGRSQIELRFQDDKVVEIDLGITSINANRVQVDGLTHQWRFGLSLDMIPETTLYDGAAAPGLLKNVQNFERGETQLNLVAMLLQAGKYEAARALLTDVERDFPDMQNRCVKMANKWNDQVGNRALEELTAMNDNGKHQTARGYARQWPEQKRAPLIRALVRVRAKQFLGKLDDRDQQLELASQALGKLVAQVENQALRPQAMEIWRALQRELDLNTLERIGAFELLQLDPGLTPESKLALAATGMMLGPDAAIENFTEAFGLLQIRALLRDYFSTLDTELTTRNALLEQIRLQEGFSVDRVALLLKNLPPTSPITLNKQHALSTGTFTTPSLDNVAGCVGQVPREYAVTRRYPLIIAFPPEGMTAADAMEGWQAAADRNGYIVVIPDLYSDKNFTYDASAARHKQLLNLLHQLKASLSIDDDRVFVAGHGIGGEAAMDIGTAHPDLFAGVVSISSLGRRHLLHTAYNSPDLAWYIAVGTLHPGWGQRLQPLVEKLFKRHAVRDRMQYSDLLFVRYDDRGYEPFTEEFPNLFRWLGFQRRAALPDRIDAAVMRSTDNSWYWLTLDEIPARHQRLEKPTTWRESPGSAVRVVAQISGAGNLIRLQRMPANATLRLSANVPQLDLSKPITVISVDGRKQTVEFDPSTRDLLDDFRERRDRQQLCLMKVPI